MSFWAALRYSDLLAGRGPIERTSIFEADDSVASGRFHAAATLKPGYRAPWIVPSKIYDSLDGCGTGTTRSQAIYKAVSEAIERWAFYALSEGDPAEQTRYGLDLNASTTGFACHPSPCRHPARSNALGEAIERWSLTHWWSVQLGAEMLPVATPVPGLRMITPFKGHEVVMIWKDLSEAGKDLRVYGFASGASIKDAIGHARDELRRNEFVLRRYVDQKTVESDFQSAIDERLVHFAMAIGVKKFEERMELSMASRIAPGPPPELVVDCRIPGPWQKYATVWRCLFAGQRSDLEDPDSFFF